jgi:predicted lipoprotein with Yx(FWY)xxD motif
VAIEVAGRLGDQELTLDLDGATVTRTLRAEAIRSARVDGSTCMSPISPTSKRLLMPCAALAASLALAACGGGDGDSPDSATAARPGTTIAVKSFDGVGDVLVESSGRALYASDVEADGKVRCTGACTSFWRPLTVGSAKPTTEAGVGRIGVVSRPDGTRQVTVAGKLLYTFSEDEPGKVEGNGFADDFDGRHFTWSAVVAGGELAGSSGGGAGEAAPGNDNGY